MKFIQPSVELYHQEDYTLEGIYKQIEKCARISYKSEDKTTENSSEAFVDNLIKAKHLSPLEHGTVYLTITLPKKAWNKTVVDKYYKNPYSRCNNTYDDLDYTYYITTNYRTLVENNWLDDLKYLCEPTEHHIKRYCVKFTTNIGVTRESNRHRSHSTTEMSTRYCNFSKDKFNNQLNIVPSAWIPTNCVEIQALRDSRTQMLMYANMISNLNLEDNMSAIDFWLFSLCTADYCYNKLIEKGWKPQQARVVLPLETYTDVVYTAFEDDWKNFFDLRLGGTTGAPHPDIKLVAQMAWDLFKENYNIEL